MIMFKVGEEIVKVVTIVEWRLLVNVVVVVKMVMVRRRRRRRRYAGGDRFWCSSCLLLVLDPVLVIFIMAQEGDDEAHALVTRVMSRAQPSWTGLVENVYLACGNTGRCGKPALRRLGRRHVSHLVMKMVRMAIRVWLKVIVQGMMSRKFRSNRWQRTCSSRGLGVEASETVLELAGMVMMWTGGIC